MKLVLSSGLVMLAAFACGGGSGGGGGSGLPSSTLIVELSADQREELCDFTVDVFGPEQTVTCDGQTATRGGEDFNECLDDLASITASAPDCTLTVGQYEGCANAVAAQTDAEFCEGSMPAACAVFATSGCFDISDPDEPPQP